MRHLLLLPAPVLFSLAFPDSAFYALAIIAIASLSEEEPLKELARGLPAVLAFLAVEPPQDVALLAYALGSSLSLVSTAAGGAAMLGALSLSLRPDAVPFYVVLLGAQLLMFYEPSRD
ncbi:hypothetical protein Pogu_2144 [Pyrobaculum oguniense TE7]|uniref:Uncharacterized protein n=1 Tax=Pyrobaculum oguniense (strain DSM 13380 / JCM 10595 / TE7) TaxID=698757 RepID=H6QCX2_PYROT|nr:hypothetical protein Pogu_2144 [Pyrobaculum oguniense TE7]